MMSHLKTYLDLILDGMAQHPIYSIWISILLALMGIAAYVMVLSLIYTLEIFEFSFHIIWAMMVSNYVFMVVSSTGLCIVTSLGHVFGLKRFEQIGKRGIFLALITILFGMISIGLHLGHPERAAIYNVLTPNFLSAMWWMGTFYTLYIGFITAELWLLCRSDLAKTALASTGLKADIYYLLVLKKTDISKEAVRKDHKLAFIVGLLALVSGLTAHNTLGALFGHLEARPLWHGSYYPIYFLLSASFSGVAWILATIIGTYKLQKKKIREKLTKLIFELAQILAVLLSVGLIFAVCKICLGLFSPEKFESIMLFLNGPFSLAFWLFEIVIGTVAPIFILLYSIKKYKITGVLIASVMVLIGVFVMRYDFVIIAQVYPVLTDGLDSYFPTFSEVLLISGIIASLFLSYTLGIKFLPLDEN
jgi:Ni/Fe-hydrogenase subunit HybB-like protein